MSATTGRKVANGHNIHLFTAEQRAIHQRNVQQYLSNHATTHPQNLEALRLTPIRNGEEHSIKNDHDEKTNGVSGDHALQFQPGISSDSHVTSRGTVSTPSNPRKKSAPHLSQVQREKLESGLYLHPTQIPRSLSVAYKDHPPDAALNVLYDLPMGDAAKKSLLQREKIQIEEELSKIEEQLRNLSVSTVHTLGCHSPPRSMRSVKIPQVHIPDPVTIPNVPLPAMSPPPTVHVPALSPPPTVTVPDPVPVRTVNVPDTVTNGTYSSNSTRDLIKRVNLVLDGHPDNALQDHDSSTRPSMMHSPTHSMTITDSTQENMAKRHTLESVKHELEKVLNAGYTRNLIIAMVQSFLGPFLYGWNIGLLNVPQDVIQNDVTLMTDSQFALLNSLMPFGGMVGSVIAGWVQDKFGRKKGMLLTDIIFLISAIITLLYAEDILGISPRDSRGYVVFWIGRFIAGMGIGFECAIIPTYLGEIAPPTIRGAVGTWHQVMICLGIVVANIVGYRQIIGGEDTWPLLFTPNILPLFQIFTAFTFPESPKWLFREGMVDEARRSLQRLRMTDDVRIEMNVMRSGFTKHESFAANSHDRPLLGDGGYEITNGATGGVQVTQFGIPLDEYKAVKWAVIIAVMLMCMQQLSGINAVRFYSSFILKDAGITSVKATWLGTLGINSTSLISVLIPMFMIDRAGRRVLLVVSGILVTIASVGVSVVSILTEKGSSPILSYFSIGFLVLFVIGFTVGLGPIPWLLMVEVSPIRYRGPIVSFAAMTNWLCMVVVGQCSTVLMLGTIKLFPFSIFTVLGVLFTIAVVPETNGKTASAIQKALNAI